MEEEEEEEEERKRRRKRRREWSVCAELRTCRRDSRGEGVNGNSSHH